MYIQCGYIRSVTCVYLAYCDIQYVNVCIFRAKIRNIEATEEAKQKIMIERMKKKDEVSHFVPTNMAVDFVQHDRSVVHVVLFM